MTGRASAHLDRNIRSFSTRCEDEELRWQKPRIERVCSILRRLPRKDTLADLGCMSGMATRYYALAGARAIHGFDVNDVSLAKLKEKGYAAHHWNMDGEPCPMPDGSFDVVIAGEIVEHLIDTDGFARELRRILAPEGHLIFTTPNLASWFNRARLLLGLPPRCYPGTSPTVHKSHMIDNDHIRVNVLTEWIHFLEHHGFQVEEVHGTSHLQAMSGSGWVRVIQWIDRLACHIPPLSVGLILLARKKPQVD